jgi:hypothetical protein
MGSLAVIGFTWLNDLVLRNYFDMILDSGVYYSIPSYDIDSVIVA